MVEPTIWPALEEIRQKQAEECKTRRTYGRTNHLACLGGREGKNREKSVRQDGPMVEPTIWTAWEGREGGSRENIVRQEGPMVEPTIWPAWEGREGGSREKIARQDGPMVEPTIWPAWEER
ncbi:hypothetical protein DPMN_131627 [Dreissena polymorpha]|uniref:Uncharacterized protein n=1 Tax=Dreissena polymorpha TaxID=45954 RepID=A0A9D4FTI0_DREPO|nr:hypothetical protein DPMN_131627 [Dreissena polymorpha]